MTELSRFSMALKEWAVVVDALLEGRQTITVRKGGISEEGGVFRTDVPEFLLFPSFLHQEEAAVRPEERHRFSRVTPPPPGKALFPGSARVRSVDPVSSAADLPAFAEETIWTLPYLERRFALMPRQPLFVLRLAVERIDPPIESPILPAWAGCRSYLPLRG